MMDDRGPRPSLICPRCGHDSPPQDTRLVSCASCGLSFDAERAGRAGPLPRRGIRRRPGVVAGVFCASSFPIRGPGTCEIGDELVATSFTRRGPAARIVLAIVALIGAMVGARQVDRVGRLDYELVGSSMVMLVVAAAAPVPRLKRAARFRIPWKNVGAVYHDPHGVRIEVRTMSPSGEILFATDGPQDMARRLKERMS